MVNQGHSVPTFSQLQILLVLISIGQYKLSRSVMANLPSSTDAAFRSERLSPSGGRTLGIEMSTDEAARDEGVSSSTTTRSSPVFRRGGLVSRIWRLFSRVSSPSSGSRRDFDTTPPSTETTGTSTSTDTTMSPVSDGIVRRVSPTGSYPPRRDPDPYATPDSLSVPHYIQVYREQGSELVSGVVNDFSADVGSDNACQLQAGADATQTPPCTADSPRRWRKMVLQLKKLRRTHGLKKFFFRKRR